MDLSGFRDEDFDVKHWINSTIRSDSDLNKEIIVNSLITDLQDYMSRLNSDIEKTSYQVIQSLPQIITDAQLLQREALVLREQMAHVKQELAQVEKNTGQSIKDIEYLDNMKNKLENAKQGLHEADNWIILANEIEELLESGDIDVISNKIVTMQSSLKILVDAPNYEERRLHLEELKNRLEAKAIPLFIKAFSSANIEQSSNYVSIFESIGRLPELLKYYRKCQKGMLLQKWRQLLEIDQDEFVSHWMHNYYDFLLSHWHSQLKWCNHVFPNDKSVITLVEVYTELLLSLDPSFNECIDAALKQTSNKLDLLLQLKQITKQFANNLQAIIENVDQQKTCSSEVLLSLAKAIYYPYVIYSKKYGSYEQNFLCYQLNSLKCIKDELPDTIQSLSMIVPEVYDLANAANTRCQNLTEGYGYCDLITALKSFFNSYIDILRIALRQIDRARGIEEDWNMFQICVGLLQTTGDFLQNLQDFESTLISNILETSKVNDNPFRQYKVLLLDAAGQKEHESLLKSLLSGDMTFMDSVNSGLQKLCNDVHHTMYQVIFTPIASQIELVKSVKTWASSSSASLQMDLPHYSYSPQEYITQIGQYLMTLPQHLEPFLLQENNSSLKSALKAADSEYSTTAADEEGGLADILLSIIARGTCQVYCNNILGISELKGGANKQLAMDIEYLGNILDDLGLGLSEQLQQLMTLLRLNADEYQTGSTKCSPRLVAAVRQMRNITSSSVK